jgi:hypothetical protein
MVRFAVEHPTVGIIGSYQQSGDRLRWNGLPSDISFLTGREAVRADVFLTGRDPVRGELDPIHFFGNPTSSLYRSDVIRRTTSFFPHQDAHADTSAVYATLTDCDYGFIHEVLSCERVHEGQLTSQVDWLNPSSVASLDLLIRYGKAYLDPAEFETELQRRFGRYNRFIGGAVWKLRNRAFWEYHRSRMAALGYPLTFRQLATAAVGRVIDEIRRPVETLRTGQGWSSKKPTAPVETRPGTPGGR